MSTLSEEDFRAVATLWEERRERLAQVTDQVRQIATKLAEWGMAPDTRDDLDHATIAYSKVCSSYECCQWLPFDVMPNWEDDLFCVLMDQDFWRAQRELNKQGYDIADMIRARQASEVTA